MATNKNFEIKNGLSVAGTERISSAGVITGSLASGVTATTQSAADSSTKIATTAYTDAAITALIGGAPSALNDLNELAAAIADDANYSTTLTTALATKLPLAGGTLTGSLLVADDQELQLGNSADIKFKHHNSGYGHLENTGILYIDAEQIQLRTDNSDVGLALTLNSSHEALFAGKVGIGTDAPTHGLTVSDLSGGDDANMRRITIKSETHGVNSGFRFDSESANGTARGGGYYFQPGDTDATTYLGLSATDGGYQMAIARNGNIAMGSAVDGAAPLHLKYAGGSYNTDATSGFISHATSGRGLIRIRSDVDAAAELFFDVNGAIRWDISARQSSESYDMHWYNQGSTPSLNLVAGPVMILTQTGRLGVGVTTPSYPLHVSGVAAATSFLGNGSTLTGIAKLTVATSAPSSPSVGDQWFDSTSTILAMKVWTGAKWDNMSNKFIASGGTETSYTSGGVLYKVHTFTSSGTFVPQTSGQVDMLIVAGGGAGGNDHGGGGGAGGFRAVTNHTASAQSYTITVGAGAASTPAVRGTGAWGANGSNSSALGITSIGGGGGGTYSGANIDNGRSGGSGGGAGGSGTIGAGTSGQGNNGGTGSLAGHYQGGGGGGASAVGTNSSTLTPNGGSGSSNNFRTGSNITYAGGGGGNGSYTGSGQYGSGGSGGGGKGANIPSAAVAGTVNTGSGGGGGARYISDAYNVSGVSGAGGSGIVIIRYPV